MPRVHRPPALLWRVMKVLNKRISRQVQSRPKLANTVLLLTTIGRKTGLRRATPLQYEEVDGMIYVAAARGQESDWIRNIAANPDVEIQLGADCFRAVAELIADPARIADFLELRRRRHPLMIRAMLLMHGMWNPDRAHLEELGKGLALVAMRKGAAK